ncbi:MAG TPA: Crp/Fnr family transcriptional regulator [Chromatiales bacterium]|nr:Crp/Fnr family transcriptional regulator [Chromatiales bacterium]
MADLTDDIFLDVFEAAPRRHLKPGETLIHAGEPATEVFNVVEGMLLVSRPGLDGRRQVLNFLFSNHFVGLTGSDRYNFTVEAVTPAIVASQPRSVLDRRLAQDPLAEKAFISMTYRVLEDLVDLAYSLGQRTARERLAVFVLYLRHRYLLSQGIPPDHDEALREIELPMTRTDIADFLGLKKETVSRSLAQLENAGLIERAGARTLRIRDLAGLRDTAGAMDFESPLRTPSG